MSEKNNSSFKALKIKRTALVCCAALLFCALGTGLYLALTGQTSTLLLQEVRESGVPKGFLPAEVAGEPAPRGGESIALLSPRSGEEKMVLTDDLFIIEDDQEAVAAEAVLAQEIDAAAKEQASQEMEASQERSASRQNRLARLQQRLDKVREQHNADRPEDSSRVSAAEEQALAQAEQGAPVQEAVSSLDEGSVQKGVIASGETVSQLLDEYLSPAAVEELEDVCKDVFPLNTIRAGHAYAVTLFEGQFKRFEYEINREKKLVVKKTEQGFEVGEQKLAFETYTVRLDGEISLSLFGALERLGEHGELALQLADIFGWQIDFIRDIRVGDTFRVLVEKRLRNEKFMGYGDILAAEFVNQGKHHQGYLFHDESGIPGYYDNEGHSLRKAFLKAPLQFSRISSDFSWRRLHPILKKYRPHPGIDYAAPTGTPVRAVGNGTVISKGWSGGGGHTVKIRHMNGYETLYMHLSRYARIAKGQKVEQGEIIGYVGSTGLSTGPHLDFRMKKNGQYINPRKVENPNAASLPQHMMPAFAKRSQKLASLLDDQEFSPVRDFAVETYLPDVAAR